MAQRSPQELFHEAAQQVSLVTGVVVELAEAIRQTGASRGGVCGSAVFSKQLSQVYLGVEGIPRTAVNRAESLLWH
jgi:hypothetical protein